MKNILSIMTELQSTDGKLKKQEIIKENLDNEYFVEAMKFLLNDFIVTGLSSKKINKEIAVEGYAYAIYNILEAIEYLKANNTGKDADIQNINFCISSQNTEEEKEFCRLLFTKDLKLGISASTWNKIVPKDLQIPVFDVMLAKKFSEHSDKVRGNFIITKKMDGTRLVIIKEKGVVTGYTRQGKEYIGLNQIESDILSIQNLDNVVFDGELLADFVGNTNEIFSETLKRSRNKDKDKKGLVYHIFDMMPLDEFKCGKSKKNAIDRKRDLSDIFKGSRFEFLNEVKPLYIGNDFSEIAKWANYAKEQGWEGIMVNLDKPYVCKRTEFLLKVKDMQSCDLKVVGFEEGDGRLKGTLGAILCEYKDNIVKVGSGFSDELRYEIWRDKDIWINRVVEIQYFEESQDSKTKLKSLRFPVFKILREEGKEISYN